MSTHLLSFGIDKTKNSYVNNLDCCEKDAQLVADTFKNLYGVPEGNIAVLKSSICSANIFLSLLKEKSEILEKGDVLILFYSGHGGQVEDLNGDEDEGFDETLCLYDRMLLDDEIHNTFCEFNEGVRIIFFSDSCHSGTMDRSILTGIPPTAKYHKNADDYLQDNIDIYKDIKVRPKEELKASLFFLSACQDDQFANTGNPNSIFTTQLVNTLNYSKENSVELTLKKLAFVLSKNQIFIKNEQVPNTKSAADFDSIPLTELISNEANNSNKNEALNLWTGDLVFTFENEAKMNAAKSQIDSVVLDDFNIEDFDEDSFILEIENDRIETIEELQKYVEEIEEKLKAKGFEVDIEPELELQEPKSYRKSADKEDPNTFLEKWPAPNKDLFDWYKKDGFTGLGSALQMVNDKIPQSKRKVRIAHIDTGCWPEHPSSPEALNFSLGRSFKKKEDITNSRCSTSGGGNKFHGVATGAILAGKEVEISDEGKYHGTKTTMGAIPFAEIIPIRIHDNVVIMGGSIKALVKAIRYAIDINCDVISMSMGGAPSKKVAKVINEAYEAGIVIVTAAGNNFNTFQDVVVPEEVVYPSRFNRVITACGATANHIPYDFDAQKKPKPKSFEGGDTMQGNWGPKKVMKFALGAYTPNVPWASIKENSDGTFDYYFSVRGGGTSSATPQIAAAAALYMVYHQDELAKYKGTWKYGEAVRKALFSSADTSKYEQWEKFYGNGILDAKSALKIEPEVKDTDKAPKDSVSWFILWDYLKMYF